MTLELPKTEPATILPDGVYIGLSFDDYLADPALGSTDAKNLLISPLKFWVNSSLNPNRPPNKETAAKNFGTLVHEVILENPDKVLAVKPEGMSFATKAGKAWKAEIIESGATILTPDEGRTLAMIVEACRRSGVSKMIEGSIPEVTYIWTDERGIRRKIRLDSMKPDMSFDLKTFANQMDKELGTCVAYATGNLRYHISAVWYRKGIDHMRAAMAKGVCKINYSDDMPQDKKASAAKVLEAFSVYKHLHPHWYIFLEKDGIPNVIPRQFVKRCGEGQPINEYWRSACLGVDHALTIFARYSKEFKPGEMWMRPTEWKPFTDEDLGAARSIFE